MWPSHTALSNRKRMSQRSDSQPLISWAADNKGSLKMLTNTMKNVLGTVGLIAALSATAFAQSGQRQTSSRPERSAIDVTAKGSVDQTVAGLKKMVADNGMMVMGEINQGKVLSMTGLKLQSETFFVGNPNVGKQLFSEEPGAGLVVPVRINVYADKLGRTHVRYVPPSSQLQEFGNDKVNQIAQMLDEKLEKLMSMATQ